MSNEEKEGTKKAKVLLHPCIEDNVGAEETLDELKERFEDGEVKDSLVVFFRGPDGLWVSMASDLEDVPGAHMTLELFQQAIIAQCTYRGRIE